jgi:GYD domain
MPKYIMLVNFTDQGLRGVKEIPNRQDKSRETAKQFAVERKTVWMTFGPYDFVHLYEAPNDEAMAKVCDDPQFLWQRSDDRHEGMGRVRTPSSHMRIA